MILYLKKIEYIVPLFYWLSKMLLLSKTICHCKKLKSDDTIFEKSRAHFYDNPKFAGLSVMSIILGEFCTGKWTISCAK